MNPINFENIVRHGKYYNPAHTHYGRKTNVVCDRCGRTNLDICIGYKDYDLCFNCVDIVNSIMKTNKKKKKENDFKYMTLMMDSKFFETKNSITRMADDLYMVDKSKFENDRFRIRKQIEDDRYFNLN